MNDIVLTRELRGLQGDKALTQHIITSKQEEMKKMLQGAMGDDMKAILNGEKTIEVSKIEQNKFKLKNWFKRLFRIF